MTTFTAEELHRAVAVETEFLKNEIRRANSEKAKLTEECNMLRYAFKGLCGEVLHLRVEISGKELLVGDDPYRYLQYVTDNAAKRISVAALERFASMYEAQAEIARLRALVPPGVAIHVSR